MQTITIGKLQLTVAPIPGEVTTLNLARANHMVSLPLLITTGIGDLSL